MSARCWATPRTCSPRWRRRPLADMCCAGSTTRAAATRWPATSCVPTVRSCSPIRSTRALLDGLELPGVQVFDVSGEQWSALLAAAGPLTPYREVAPTDTFMMIFTSGTSGEPKAVQITHLVVLFAGIIADRAVRPQRLRRLLSVHAAVPLQRAARRLERGGGRRRGHGSRRRSRHRGCFPIFAATGSPT